MINNCLRLFIINVINKINDQDFHKDDSINNEISLCTN